MESVVPTAGRAHENSGAVSGGGERTSGRGRADGGVVWKACDGEPDGGLRFDQPVEPNGYHWWYIDALSDDKRHGLTIIAFVGSVFSPYYAFARRRGEADPLNHCALNIALYGEGGKRWAMTERGKAAVARDATSFAIGPSALSWDDGVLIVRFEETAVPSLGRIRGTVRVIPAALTRVELVLDGEGRHFWRPLAPCARVEVDIEEPRLQWSGEGYLDTNRGDEPLADGFVRWDWSRASFKDGAAVVYQLTRRRDGDLSVGLRFDRHGGVVEFEPPPRAILPSTFWRIPRYAASETPPKLVETLEDAPFYARSLVETRLLDRPVTIFHESLSLDRFRMPVVQLMLPFRMPRRAGRAALTLVG